MSFRSFSVLAVIFSAVSISSAAALTPEFVRVATIVSSDKAHDVLKSPQGIAVVKGTGDVIVADTAHHRLLKVSARGDVALLAGSGKPGFADGTGSAAQFKEPVSVAVDESRRLVFVADSGNHSIRAVTFEGVVTTLAGSGRPEDKDGTDSQAGFKQPGAIAVDAAGTIFVADTGNSRIKQVTPSGVVTTIAGDVHEGFADGVAPKAQFKAPQGIAIGPDGAIYVADTKNNVIRKVQDGIVSTVAGTGHGGFVDGAAATAEFKEPQGIACDEAGRLYVADTKNHAIRELAKSNSFTVTTLAGSGKAGFADGSLSSALFREPAGIAFAGALFLADAGNDAIRRFDPQVAITSIDPHTGAAGGGTEVHVIGAGFLPGATQVTFGAAPATNVRYVTSTELIVIAPAVTGVVDVAVTTSAGSATLPNAYSTVPPPTIATVLPRKGRTTGGEVVVITGSNFTSGMTVTFGAVPATAVTVTSSNALEAITPPTGAGTVDVTVTNAAGSVVKTAAFTFFAPPLITSFTPTDGAAGTIVTITGTGFDVDPTGNVVFFGTRQAAVTAASATQLVVVAPDGTTTARISVATAGGAAASSTDFTVASYVSLEITAPVSSFDAQSNVPLNAIARTPTGSGNDVSTQALWTTSDTSIATVSGGMVTGRSAGTATINAVFHGFTAAKTIVVTAATIPTVLPPTINQAIVQPLADSVRFLYTGAAAVQTGVAANVINDDRVTTIRGTVHSRTGVPLAGVEVVAANHPEFGHTFTRADGAFDFAVNGGSSLTLVYRKAGWLESQRVVTSRWNEQLVADDVVLIPFDAAVTLVSMGSPNVQTVRGAQMSDSDGARTATIVVPAGQAATVTTPDGVTTTPTSIHIRATEYTVGESGPAAMPAQLPAFSGYTYCVELSADEALGGSVQYSKPVSVYVDNFLSFPVGTAVPVGIYDRARQRWTAGSNGRVIGVVDVSGGVAMIDTNGDGIAESDGALALLGIDQAERRTLGSLYAGGRSLWRVRTTHFSPIDLNFPKTGPADATKPAAKGKVRVGRTSETCNVSGWSIIDCSNQALRESIPIQGTPYSLEYDSSRAALNRYSAQIDLSGDTIPASLERIDLRVRIAGQDHSYQFPAQTNLKYTFTWDGRDGFGRPVQGAQKATIDITYAYPLVYTRPGGDPAFNMPGELVALAMRAGIKYTLTESTEIVLGHFGSNDTGFGGWTFSPQRGYDGGARTVYEADGVARSIDPQQTRNTVLTTLPVGDPDSLDLFTMAPAPDGTLFFSDGYKIKKLTSDGVTTDVAGTTRSGFTPDGQPVLGNPLNLWQFVTGPDGALYVIDATRVRAIVNGRWVTIAGTDTYETGTEPDGVSATSRAITAWSLATGADGAVYVGSLGRIYKISPDGIIQTIAGFRDPGGRQGVFVDGAPARSVPVGTPSGLAVGPDGSVYFANNEILGRVSPDGRLFHVMTGASTAQFDPHALAVAGDGTVLLGDINGRKVWAIAPDGSVSTFAGTGEFSNEAVLPPTGMSRSFMLGAPLEVKIAPDGSVLILDWWFEAIRRADAGFPPMRTGTPALVPSEDGSLAYVFENGRHTRTVNAMTGTNLEVSGYDDAGHLVSVTNVDGLVTQIERNGAGEPTAISAPNGQRTILSTADAKLRSVTDPSGIGQSFEYGVDSGLLSRVVDRRGGEHRFTYDPDGLLLRDDDPAGGFVSLVRTGTGTAFSIVRTSAEGRSQTYSTAVDVNGSQSDTHVRTTGATTTSTRFGGALSVQSTAARSSSTIAADPRFGMLAPLVSGSVAYGSKSLNIATGRSVTLNDASNALSVRSISESLTVNGHTWLSTYDSTTRQLIFRSPAGRQSVASLDAKGRATSLQHSPSIATTSMSYDSLGRIASVDIGTRQTTYSYDGNHRLQSVTDPLHRTVGFTYDAANRVTRESMPDGSEVSLSYDADGNVTSITPPDRQPYLFSFTPVGLLETYTPPSAGDGGIALSYAYNRDRQLTSFTKPDGEAISLHYDGAGRLSAITAPHGDRAYAYEGPGQLAAVTTRDGASISYSHDGAALTQQTWSGPVTGSVLYSYDGDLRLASENGIAYSYDADGMMTAAGSLTLNRNSATGLLTSTTLGIVTDAWTYDAYGAPASYTVSLNGAPALSQTYTRDDAGRITGIIEASGTRTTTVAYSYDAAGHLKTITRDGQLAVEYAYDSNGNRLPGTYDAQDRLRTLAGVTYGYTRNGELESKVDANGMTRYAYDSFGNLRTVILPDGRQIDYVMDGENHRVAKKINGAMNAGWLYADGLRIVAELDAAGTVAKRFIYGSRATIPDYMVWNGVMYRIIADHVGSPRFVIEASSGAVVEAITYDEFGSVTSDTSKGLLPFGFAGGLRDFDTELVRFGGRDYDPLVGRWTTKDPRLFSAGTNHYLYAHGDPVNYIDADGQIPVPLITGAIGGAFGALGSIGSQLWTNRNAGFGGMFKCIDWGDVGIAAGTGFLAGAAAPFTAVTWLGAIGTSALANEVQYVATESRHGREPQLDAAAWSVATGAAGGAIGGKFTAGSAGYNAESVITSAEQRQLFKQLNDEATVELQVGRANLARNLFASGASGAPQPGSSGDCGCK